MAKRFIDSGLFLKRWFSELKPTHKLFWIYAFTNCDHAGFLEFYPNRFSFDLGVELDIDEIRRTFGGKIVDVEDGEKWWLPDFIRYQYGELNPSNRVHNSVLKALELRGIDGSCKGHARPLQGSKDKDKDKSKVKEKERFRAKPKNLEMVIKYFREKSIPEPESNAKKFFDHYEANGWYRGKTKIKSWRHCLSQWDFDEPGKRGKTKLEDFKTDTTGHYIGFCTSCGESSFYDKFHVWGDSSCCESKIAPERMAA